MRGSGHLENSVPGWLRSHSPLSLNPSLSIPWNKYTAVYSAGPLFCPAHETPLPLWSTELLEILPTPTTHTNLPATLRMTALLWPHTHLALVTAWNYWLFLIKLPAPQKPHPHLHQ